MAILWWTKWEKFGSRYEILRECAQESGEAWRLKMENDLVRCLAPMMAVHLARCLAPTMAVHIPLPDIVLIFPFAMCT